MQEDEQGTMHAITLILFGTIKPEVVTARDSVAIGFAGVLRMTDHAAHQKEKNEDISRHKHLL
jgi:hypothetical protein